MARARSKLDEKGQASEVLECLEKEPAGWKRERLLALKHGLETVLTSVLAQYWSDAKPIRDLIGTKGWLVAQANAISPSVLLIT